LRYCAKSQKKAGLIPEGVTGIFREHKPSVTRAASTSNSNEYQEFFLGVKVGNFIEIWEPQTPRSLQVEDYTVLV
jgi:hypothetical protein